MYESGAPSPEARLGKPYGAILSFDEQSFAAAQKISYMSGYIKHIADEPHGLPYLAWRNYLLSKYNLTIVYLIKGRMTMGRDDETIKTFVNELIVLYVKLQKLLLLEESNKDYIASLIRQGERDVQRPKVVKNKNIDLFGEKDNDTKPNSGGENLISSSDDEVDNVKRNLNRIREKQDKYRSLTRLTRGSAARELFYQHSTMPEEQVAGAGDVENKEIQEIEDEMMRRLSKRKKKEFLKTHKDNNRNVDGFMERDILDGIESAGSNARRAFYKKDRK